MVPAIIPAEETADVTSVSVGVFTAGAAGSVGVAARTVRVLVREGPSRRSPFINMKIVAYTFVVNVID